MSKLVFAAVAALSLAVAAEAADAEKDAKRSAARQRMLERSGGIVEKPGEGKLVFVNCQKKISDGAIAKCVADLARVLQVNIQVEKGAWAMDGKIPDGANAAVYLVDDAKLPMSLIAPEARWGVVNVAPLDTDKRFACEFLRVSILTFGAGTSNVRSSVMQTVFGPEDLDRLTPSGVPFDSLTGLMLNIKNLGVTQIKRTSYRKACMDGWANPPTNDYQKAIWEEVHSKPTDPMKIKFDPKKGE